MKCHRCHREATQWYIRKRRWIDCCNIHFDAHLRKEQPLLYQGKAKNQRKELHPALQVLICFLLGALFAYTCAGTI